MEELKPCPFCGSAPTIETTSGSDERMGYNITASVVCSCGASLSVESLHDKQGWNNEPRDATIRRAANAWNRRTPPPPTTKGA